MPKGRTYRDPSALTGADRRLLEAVKREGTLTREAKALDLRPSYVRSRMAAIREKQRGAL